MSEASDIAELAQQSVIPTQLIEGEVYSVPDGNGGIHTIDTDEYADHPRRPVASRVVYDAPSFIGYLKKHGLPESEVWADTPNSSVVAVVDAHQGATVPAGWQKHRLTLALQKSLPWQAWTLLNQKWFSQMEFAEFIQERAVDVLEPSAADMLELAQHFNVARKVDFESSERLTSGETNLTFKETLGAKAGSKGQIAIPDKIILALRPYIGGPKYQVKANFRYRLDGGSLVLGFVLDRPQEVLDMAFEDIVAEIRDGQPAVTARAAMADKPAVESREATPGITQPIYYGKP